MKKKQGKSFFALNIISYLQLYFHIIDAG